MSQNNEGGITSKDFLERVAEGSGNMDESGNFSIEVLIASRVFKPFKKSELIWSPSPK